MATHTGLFHRNFVVCINLPTDIKRDLYVYYIISRREKRRRKKPCHLYRVAVLSQTTASAIQFYYPIDDCCCSAAVVAAAATAAAAFFPYFCACMPFHTHHYIPIFPDMYFYRMIYIANSILAFIKIILVSQRIIVYVIVCVYISSSYTQSQTKRK